MDSILWSVFEPASRPTQNMAVKVVFNGFSIRRVSDNLTLPFLSIHSSSKEEAVWKENSYYYDHKIKPLHSTNIKKNLTNYYYSLGGERIECIMAAYIERENEINGALLLP